MSKELKTLPVQWRKLESTVGVIELAILRLEDSKELGAGYKPADVEALMACSDIVLRLFGKRDPD